MYIRKNFSVVRQLKIIQILANSINGKTVKELTENIESKTRNIYRDIESLQATGVPLYKEGNRWLVIKSSFVNLFKKEPK